MSLPHLSQELIDSILDHLQDDIRALTKCALVSQSFLPTAQRHLFATLDLDTSQHGARTCEKLLNALSLNPCLAQYIETLNLRLYSDSTGGSQVLINTLSALQHLRSISLRSSSSDPGRQWTCLPRELQSALLARLQHSGMTAASITGFRGFPLDIFMHCRHLKHLAIEGVLFSPSEHGLGRSSDVAPSEGPSGRLESLSGGEWETGAGSTRALILFLTDQKSSLRLTHLKCFAAAVRSNADCSSFQNVIHIAARSLEDLTLSIHCKATSLPGPPIDISSLTCLKRIALTVFEDLRSPRWLLSLLGTAPACSQIHEVALTVLFSNFDDSAWGEIDRTLALAPQFSNVRKVILRYWINHGKYRKPEMKFPCCAEKGVLVVFSEGDLVFPVKMAGR